MNSNKRVALYLRVSTSEQTVENQRRELNAVASRHGWQVVAVFKDEGISGAKGREKRPGFDQLCRGIARREFDQVAAWSLDRLSRKATELLGFVEELKAKDIDLYLHTMLGQAMDLSTPGGKFLFTIVSGVAEYERALIVERVNAGLARARAEGKQLGRPSGLTPAKERKVRRLLVKNVGVVKIGRAVKIGTGTVQRIKSALATPPA